MPPTRPLGFWAAWACCWLLFNFLCTRSLRSFLASLLTVYTVIGLLGAICRACLPLSNFLRFLWDRFSSFFSRLALQRFGCSLQLDLSCLITCSRAKLCASEQLLCIDCNPTSSPFQPIFSEELVSIHCSTPVTWAMSPHPNEMIALQLCTDFSYFLVLPRATYVHIEALEMKPPSHGFQKQKCTNLPRCVIPWPLSHCPCSIALEDGKLSPAYLV